MKKDITKKREKSQKMAGRSLRNDEIAELLDQPLPDSDSDDYSSDEEGDVGPDRLVNATDGLFAPGQEDVPVLVDVQNDAHKDVQNLQDALDDQMADQIEPEQSDHLRTPKIENITIQFVIQEFL